jgi:hypothetical protein
LFKLLTFWLKQNPDADADDGDARAIVAINTASEAKSTLPLFIVSCIYLLLWLRWRSGLEFTKAQDLLAQRPATRSRVAAELMQQNISNKGENSSPMGKIWTHVWRTQAALRHFKE